MNLRLRVFAAFAVAGTLTPSLIAQPLPSDPSFTTGRLDNGLRYIVKQNAIPPGRAVMWVHMHTGSLNESDRQRGLAHYLEHMAFNGSANFAPGTLVPFFQSLGMTFGRDQNAFTNFEQTTYQLSLPDTSPETMSKGMTFFADVIGRLSLLPNEIDEERGIIQEERRRGLSGRQRTSLHVLKHIAPGSLYGERETIGTEETIGGVQRDDFLDYYTKWYGASNATLMVVADADPAAVVTLIGHEFGGLPAKPRPTPQDPGIKAYEKSFAIVASDPELRSANLRIVRIEPARPATTTEPLYREELVRRLAQSAMNRRLSDKVARGGTSYLNASCSMSNDPSTLFEAAMSCGATAEKWKPALDEMALELQRARAFGFSPRELDDVKKQMISGAERAVETEGTQTSGEIIRRLNADVTAGEPTMSASQRLELLKRMLPGIDPAEVSRVFAAEFDPAAVAFVAVLPSEASVPTESELLELGTKALAVTPAPESESVRATQLMTELPKGGEVTELAEHAASKVWTGWLSNNAKVNYRFMDERKNEVSIQVSLTGGEMLESADNRGFTRAAELAWSRPATKHLSSSDIRDLMTGRKVSVRGGGGFGGGRGGGGRGPRAGGAGLGGGDAISLTISGSPDELETGFQLAYLMLTEPKIEEAAFNQYKTTAKEFLQEMLTNPMMLGMRLAGAAPYPEHEPRMQPMTLEQIDRITLDGAQAWLEQLIRESPIEVTIVGDLPRERAMELTAKYIGALPPRERIAPTSFADRRKIERPSFPPGGRVIEKTVETPTKQAFVYSGFYGADETNLEDVRALNMAARILSTRMVKEVREEAQLVYSISANSRPAATYPGFGIFSASAPTDPAKTAALVAKLRSMYEAFAKDGPTEDELIVAKKQSANTFDEQMREPGFWAGRVHGMTFRGGCLDDILEAPAAYQAITASQIREAFSRYYSKDKSIVVVVTPEEMPAVN